MSEHIVIKGLEVAEDAFGNNIQDCYQTGNHYGGYEIEERDDGRFTMYGDSNAYFEPIEEWSQTQQRLAPQIQGKVLDVGCGGGKHALFFQKNGCKVYAMDNSPLAIETCKSLGLQHTIICDVGHFQELRKDLVFDQVVFWGNNLGLMQNERFFVHFMHLLEAHTHAHSTLFIESMSPYGEGFLDDDTKAYVAHNLRQGRMGGQMRVKVRYKKFATPWSDYLFASPEELEAMLLPTAWQIDTVHNDPVSHQYIAQIIRKA